MAIDPSAVWDFAKEVVGAARIDRGRTLATVTRIDADGTTWVTTGDGGEAPAASAAAGVSVGDTVTLEWDGSAMGIRGNVSNPSPAGSVIRRAVARAQGVADAAQRVADAVNQHFFADTSGIHVTEATQEDWETNHSGPNVLINSVGQLFRDGLNNLISITTENNARAISFFDGLGNAAANVTAYFGSSGAQIGRSSDSHLSVTNSGMSLSRPLSDSGFDVGLGPRTAEQNESSAEPITEVPVVHELKWTPQQGSIRVLKDNLDRTFAPPSGERTYAYTLDGKEVTLTDARLVGYRYLIDYTATDFSDVSLTVGSRDSGSVGRASTAFGYMLIAAGDYSHAEGNRSNAEGTSAHAEGLRTKAFDSAHAEGAVTTASGYASHAEGVSTTASGYASHAEGNYSEADGPYSHAEGRYTKASGYYAHAQNQGTLASAHNQTAIGRYNIAGPGALIIGNGTDDDNRSNAFVVGWDGSLDVGGTVLVPESGKVGLNSDVPSGGTVDVSISFAKEHGAAPNVIVGLYSTSTAGAIGQVSAAVTSVTTTGFVARLFNAGTSARRPGLYWMTLG